MADLLLKAVAIMLFFAITSVIAYKAKGRGSLLSGMATPRMRFLALLMGIVFADLFVGDLISSNVTHLAFPLLAATLIGYSLGAGALLRIIQRRQRAVAPEQAPPAWQTFNEPNGETPNEKESVLPQDGCGRLFAIVAVILLLGTVAIDVAMQAAAHPDHPLSTMVVVSVVLGSAVLVLLGWLGQFAELLGAIGGSGTSDISVTTGSTATHGTFIEQRECKICGATVRANATACPVCGAKFES